MGDYDMGPRWLWNLILLFALFGVVSGVFGLIKGILWVIHHVKIN